MKRGGAAIAVFLVAAGALRWASPGSSPLSSGQLGSESKQSLIAGADDQTPKRGPIEPYPLELADTIQKFYGVPHEEFIKLQQAEKKPLQDTHLRDLIEHWSVPEPERNNVHFLIALLFDPAHTQLNLTFDRGIETIQQAAQTQGYDFDRAIMPWNIDVHRESSDFAKRQEEADDKARREAFPGLMIFRSTAAPDAGAAKDPRAYGPLFVFVVGESPTGGIRKDEFANALEIIRQIQTPHDKPRGVIHGPLVILGPSSSGSLYSVNQALSLNQASLGSERIFVFSGTTRGTGPRCWFQGSAPNNVRFVAFQEGENYVIRTFIEYARGRGYDASEIAILSEDETAYGNSTSDPSSLNYSSRQDPGCGSGFKIDPQVFESQFPRGISQFRSAYEKQVSSEPSSQQGSQVGRAVLPLDLQATGSDDDSVAPYAKIQSPLSQEAVMLGILLRLHQHHPKLIVLRASDPVDQLFLSRYLRQNYPQGRVVVTAPDLLFSREDDGLMNGVLGISAYPLTQDVSPYHCQPRDSISVGSTRTFASTSEVGTYNATLALLAIEKKPGTGEPIFEEGLATPRADLPVAPYVSYGNFIDWTASQPPSCALAPGLWMYILGRGGYWTVDAFPRVAPKENETSLHQIAAEPFTQHSTGGLRTPKAWTFAYVLVLFALFVHTYLVCNASILSGSEINARFGVVEDSQFAQLSPGKPWRVEAALSLRSHRRRRAVLLAMGAAYLAVIALLLVGVRHALVASEESLLGSLMLALLPVASTCFVAWNLGALRGEPLVGGILASGISVVALLMFLPYVGPTGWMAGLTAYRAMHLTSGVSPLLPLLLLFAAGYVVVWFELQGLSVTDSRRPCLPSRQILGATHYRVSEDDVCDFRKMALPLSLHWPIVKPLFCLLPLLLLMVDLRHPHPVQTMEGMVFDWVYAISLLTALLIFLGCLSRLFALWDECRRFLGGLDNLPLRDAFKRLQDFNWSLMWSPGGSALRDSYKFVSRELENLRHLKQAIQPATPPGDSVLPASASSAIDAAIWKTSRWQAHTHKKYSELLALSKDASKQEKLSKTSGLICSFSVLQRHLAETAGVVMLGLQAGYWSEAVGPVASSVPRDAAPKKPPCQLVAEEYVSLVYANFLTSALMRMRTLVLEAIGIYLCILLSISFYPFEPNPAMFTLAILLIVALGVVVAYVYSQMHRDAALSRLTSTAEGELGFEFWMQFVGAGALPVLSLLAVQFPAISHILTGFLQPALESVK